MKRAIILALSTIFIVSAGIAFAEYPDRPITYIISFNPGGESDITARLQEPLLEEALGVAVNVNHKSGGGGA
ncbi:MAG: tripartite tricarboxylate transporter substrate binding protein, partial [Deltaproteobacteria bacterium]|nr:tripartite tricarboxylate transporter substrate binding protein [Deltaproteobacteria bacterium]